jgi:hypothetical protein
MNGFVAAMLQARRVALGKSLLEFLLKRVLECVR